MIAVVTIVHGRHDHLRNQRRALLTSERPADLHVVVAMGDPGVRRALADSEGYGPPVLLEDLPADPAGLPLAAARNRAAALALGAGADVLVFLDVDCLPTPGLVGRYAQAVRDRRGAGSVPAVWCGATARLPQLAGAADYPVADPPVLSAMAVPDRGRPVLADGAVQAESDFTTFWSLNFALGQSDWAAVGGFDEAYVGYGGEDTDFGQRLGRVGGRLVWTGGATALHQWHETQSPPVGHLADIVRNANLFAQRWGWWPMEGWLEGFRAQGLAQQDGPGGRWRVAAEQMTPESS